MVPNQIQGMSSFVSILYYISAMLWCWTLMFIIKTRFLHFATLALNCKHGAVISKICKWLNSVNTKETSLEYFSNHRESKYQFGFNGSYITSTTTGQSRNTIYPWLIILYDRFILNDLSLDMYFTPAWFNFVFCHVLQFNSLQYPTIQLSRTFTHAFDQ